MVDVFELAARKKFRFQSPAGLLTVEELWDLPLQAARRGLANLDDIAIALNKQLKDSGEESFVSKSRASDATLQPKLDILRHIIGEKLAAKEKAEKSAERRQRQQRVLQLIAEKDDAELAGKSKDELKKLAAELEAEDED